MKHHILTQWRLICWSLCTCINTICLYNIIIVIITAIMITTDHVVGVWTQSGCIWSRQNIKVCHTLHNSDICVATSVSLGYMSWFMLPVCHFYFFLTWFSYSECPFSTPWVPPVGAGRCDLGKGRLGLPAEAAKLTTWLQIDGWMDGEQCSPTDMMGILEDVDPEGMLMLHCVLS